MGFYSPDKSSYFALLLLQFKLKHFVLKKLYLAVQIPVVSLNDDGRIVLVSDDNAGATKENEPVNKEKIKLKLNSYPFGLTCILHENYILADPTSEEESIMETYLTVVLDSSLQLVSLNKPGGPGVAHRSAIQVIFTPYLFFNILFEGPKLFVQISLLNGLYKKTRFIISHLFGNALPSKEGTHHV